MRFRPFLLREGRNFDLQEEGLIVRLRSREDNTWHIADGGLYSGYIASGDELVELKRTNNLNISWDQESGLARAAKEADTHKKEKQEQAEASDSSGI